jgi:hypothetical protein
MHNRNGKAENDDFWVLERAKQSDGVSEAGSFIVLFDADDVPAVLFDIGQELAVVLVSWSRCLKEFLPRHRGKLLRAGRR